jgi:hypothetical protein
MSLTLTDKAGGEWEIRETIFLPDLILSLVRAVGQTVFGRTARVAYSTASFGSATSLIFTFLAVFVITRFVGTIVDRVTRLSTVVTDHIPLTVSLDGLVLSVASDFRVLGFTFFLGNFGPIGFGHKCAFASGWLLFTVTGSGTRRNN